MEIRRLKLSGFKSFVDATELRIEPGLTGIVGPNGCGKSNLLEAIRWVMGEASARAMRGGGMEDVIFAGTATRPQRDFAEVSLTALQAAGTSLPSFDIGADGEVEIVRRIERGAGSAYRANGKDVRAKDVSLLFADAATGAHSPALVSQGKIAAVIAARPQERRAMLEEAAGIAGLHVRRKDAESKLRAAEANLARLDELLSDMDQRIASLRRQARAAERYTRLSEQIRLAEAKLLYVRWKEAAGQAEAAQSDAASAEQAVAAAHDAQTATAAHANAALDALGKARAATQQAADLATQTGHQLSNIRNEREQISRRLQDLAQQAQRLEDDRARESALAEDAIDAIARLTGEIDALKARIALTKASAPDYGARIAEAREAAHQAELALARAMAEQASEQAELRVAEAALAAAHNRLERARRDLGRLEAEAAQLPDPAPLKQQSAEAAHRIATAEADHAGAELQLACAEEERLAAIVTRSAAASSLSAAKAELSALDAELNALSRDLARDSGSGEAAGKLLDQLRAAPGYEHALAAALGDDLDAPLDPAAASHWAGADIGADDPALPAGLVPLASHVIAPPLLARRLAQIGVVDRDEGQPLAVGQRLVTRDGQLRRWDGLIVREGGASTAQRLVRRNRHDELSARRPALAASVEQAQAALTAADAALATIDTSIRTAGATRSDAEKRLSAALRERDQAQSALERLAARTAESRQRLAEAQSELAAMEEEYQAAQQARTALPDGSATSAQVAAHSAALDTARQTVSQLQADAALAERALASDGDRLTAAQAEAKSWHSRSGEAVRRIAEMTARAEAIAREQEEIASQPDLLIGQIATMEADHARMLAEAEAARTTEHASEAALRSAEAQHVQAGETLAKAREQRAGAQARAEHAQTRRVEIARACGERFACPPAILPEKAGFDSSTVASVQQEQADLDRFTLERERIGPVNLVAASELVELEEAQVTSRSESAELVTAINQLRGSIGSLNREGRQRLLAAFEEVDGHFRRLFTSLFNGGQARLELVDSDDALEAGLEILAQPPGKKLSTLTLLSGGEQALTAVALIFALFLTNPAPICVLDEVDAPLDDANVERFCDLLDQMVRNTKTRYLIVTHNAVTMARMHRLFGVTMVEQGISRLVSVDLGAAERLLAAE